MKVRKLGTTGLEVSALSYGAAALGSVFRDIDPAEGVRTVHAAVDGGVNLIDVKAACRDTARWCADQGVDLAKLAVQYATQARGYPDDARQHGQPAQYGAQHRLGGGAARPQRAGAGAGAAASGAQYDVAERPGGIRHDKGR
ncbi:hypothetical protein [Paenibacillus sabuli]|uniref:hypothetical protein n=1 Tax=Paenibacillus sabuli TaxID=2772509 RepID=UPI0037C66C5C